jgi:type II secretory pathway pseudopilin PulG
MIAVPLLLIALVAGLFIWMLYKATIYAAVPSGAGRSIARAQLKRRLGGIHDHWLHSSHGDVVFPSFHPRANAGWPDASDRWPLTYPPFPDPRVQYWFGCTRRRSARRGVAAGNVDPLCLVWRLDSIRSAYWFQRLIPAAKAIEARRAETRRRGSVHESASARLARFAPLRDHYALTASDLIGSPSFQEVSKR